MLKTRTKWIYRFFIIFMFFLFAFSLRWQVFDSGKFGNISALRNQVEFIPGLRGPIYASDDSTLAYSDPRYNLYIYLDDLKLAEAKNLHDREELALKVAPIVDIPYNKILNTIYTNESSGYRWFKIADSITLEQGEKINALRRDRDASLPEEQQGKLLGYTLIATAERIYPEADLAAQVLGLTTVYNDGKDLEIVGKGGIEGEWDGYLEPIQGLIVGETDAIGNVVGLSAQQSVDIKAGYSIHLTIDKEIQRKVQEVLKKAHKEYQTKSISAVLINPKTGAIMSMANYPSYNPNTRSAESQDAYGNKAIAEPYEIGSVGKVYTLATALDLGVVTPDDILLPDGHNGCEKLFEELEPICTADKQPQPAMPISEAFSKSDNLYFIALANKIKQTDFYDYLTAFGLGTQTGIDIEGESFGYLIDRASWGPADIAAYSYGHAYQQTLLQATVAVGVVANDGIRVRPYMVKGTTNPEGEYRDIIPQAVEQVLSDKSVSQMKDMMHSIYTRTIRDGEFQYYDLKGLNLGVKSGTALIPRKDAPGYTSEINTSYVGFDASEDSKFVLGLRMEEPQVGDLSSQNARLVWLDLVDALKDDLGL